MTFLSTLPRFVSRALLPFVLLAPAPLLAQEDCSIGVASAADVPAFAMPDDPWIYRGTDIPIDSQWLMGELPNGVRYAVRQNEVPPCQVSIRVRIDAGSLHESESELGYAHLVEHLTFRQSRHFGPGEAIPHFQRWGASLGFDTNAVTTPTQTVYQLDLPNAFRDRLEQSMMLFAGMIQQPTLSAENLAADVPVVLAERRERLGADLRIAVAMRELLYSGQLLARRAPMGTVEALQGATAQSVRAFHQRWYRPQNTVVVMVGDASPQVLAAMVERHFGGWEVPGAVTPEPDFGQPVAPAGADPANPVGETAVIVEAGQPRSLTYAVMRPWVGVVDNLEYNRGLMADSIAQAIVNRRLEEQARAGSSYLYAQVQQDKTSRSADATFVSVTPLTDDWQTALAEVRAVIADALETPPTQAEIDQAVAQLDVAFVGMVEQERIQAGSTLADNLVGAVDIREAVAAPETFLSVFRSMTDRLTPDVLLQHTRRLFTGDVVRGVLLTPEAGEASPADLRNALLAPVETAMLARNDGPAVSFADLPPIGTPSLPMLREPLGPGLVSSTERIVFPNGVRALMRPSGDNEPGRVTVRVRFGHGLAGFAADEAVYAELGQRALVNSGVGPLDQNDLDRIGAGRKLSFGFGIEEGAFTFEGITRAEDLADQLYLFAAKLDNPRWDMAPVERAKASALLSYDSQDGDPMSVLGRELETLLRDGDPRFRTATPDVLRAATASEFRRVWSRMLAQGPVEVAVFGDIDPAATIEALGRTFGALEPRSDEVPVLDPPGFAAANHVPVELYHGGDGDQGAALIAWPTGGGSAGLPQARKLEVLSQLVGNRLLDGLRETGGSSYTPSAISNWPLDMEGGGYVLALVQMAPQDIPAFFTLVDEIVADLAANGPTPDELERVIEPMRNYIFRAQTGHTFWLNEVEGAAFDPYRVAHLPTLAADYILTTSEEVQALAQRYLTAHDGYKVVVLPRPAGAGPAGDAANGR